MVRHVDAQRGQDVRLTIDARLTDAMLKALAEQGADVDVKTDNPSPW